MSKKENKVKAVWTAQPGPQADAIAADWCPILLYGGAKYGGKTQFLLGDYLQDVATYGEHWQGVIFRRALSEFTELKLAAQQIYPKVGAKWMEKASEWRFPNGAILRFRFLEKLSDISIYEGQGFPWLGIDELGDWEDETAFFRCLSLNRYGRIAIPNLRLRATCNPGGRGHQWLKKYFVDPAKDGYLPLWDDKLKCNRMFIPAKLEDNKIGLTNDPNYINRLMRSGSESLVRALRYGDWEVVAGSYFNGFGQENILEDFPLPHWWTRFMSLDPGSSDPFCYTWWAVSDGSIQGIPQEALICYREWYGEKETSDGTGIKGLQMPLSRQADGIKSREKDELISYRVAGIDLWDTKRGPSPAEIFSGLGINFIRAETKRKSGWTYLHNLIKGEAGVPMVYWFSSCRNCIQHIPLAQHKIKDLEDIEESPNVHTLDSCRYAVMSRPFMSDKPVEEVPLREQYKPPTLKDLWEEHEQILNIRR